MAYNLLSGSVLASREYIPGDLVVENLVSGTFKGDGSNIEYVPRVSNATNNALVTNVGGDANTLTCESNLTFDGTTLSLTGELTASLGLSASYLMGDGSRLTGITGGGGGGSPGGGTTEIQFNDAGSFGGSAALTWNGSLLSISGALSLSRRQLSASSQISELTTSADDYYVGLNSTAGILQLELADATALVDGQTYVFKDEGGAANTNNITIYPSGSQTIDGQNSIVLESPYAAIQLYCDGISKYFIC